MLRSAPSPKMPTRNARTAISIVYYEKGKKAFGDSEGGSDMFKSAFLEGKDCLLGSIVREWEGMKEITGFIFFLSFPRKERRRLAAIPPKGELT